MTPLRQVMGLGTNHAIDILTSKARLFEQTFPAFL